MINLNMWGGKIGKMANEDVRDEERYRERGEEKYGDGVKMCCMEKENSNWLSKDLGCVHQSAWCSCSSWHCESENWEMEVVSGKFKVISKELRKVLFAWSLISHDWKGFVFKCGDTH